MRKKYLTLCKKKGKSFRKKNFTALDYGVQKNEKFFYLDMLRQLIRLWGLAAGEKPAGDAMAVKIF